MPHSSVVDLAWQLACTETVGGGQQFIEPEHFLEALTKLPQLCGDEGAEFLRGAGVELATGEPEMTLTAGVLSDNGVDPDALRHQLRKRLGKGDHAFANGETVHRSERSRTVFSRARDMAQDTRGVVNAGHLFLAILAESDSIGCTLLAEMGAEPRALAKTMHQRLAAMPAEAQERKTAQSGTPCLDQYGRDLTRSAREQKIGPVIGRRREILAVIQTLARRTKNNPVLVGEAGVGKTAVAEAVAIRAAAGKDPQVLDGKRIVELSMSALVAGTKYRGEFEKRLSGIIDECKSHPEVILFIDELHTLIGAGRAEGGMDAANILKPALARGEIRCIGATTVAEYRRYIESDAALERRFERVLVPEPSPEEAAEILRGLKPALEAHHGVSFTDAAIESAVELSVRFDAEHQLPDKAIDLLDKAGARTVVPELSLLAGTKAERAAAAEGSPPLDRRRVVDETLVARALSEKIGIPMEVITGCLAGTGRSRLLEMAAFLKQRIIGQDEAIDRVCGHLLMAHAGLQQRRGPLGVFLFLGPTGVGKTELARALAIFLFGSEKDMIRLDMSEMMEEHSVAKLIGSPPGYVGHEEEGQLTGRLRSRPYSVVLLDEVEKAHPRVFDLFLQVFDDGRLTDAKGRTVDARHAIFILTSNISGKRHLPIGFERAEASQQPVLDELGKHFRSEFLNRIDGQIVFRQLERKDVKVILGPLLAEIAESLQQKYGKSLRISAEAIELLASQGYSPDYGARYLARTVQSLLEEPLSRLILSEDLANWSAVEAVVRGERLILQPGTESAPARQETAADSPRPAVCCECGEPIPESERRRCGWINGMFICDRCRVRVERMARSSRIRDD